MKRKTELQKLAEFINSYNCPFEYCDIIKHSSFSTGTFRKTITYLCKAGYINRVDRGVYKRTCHIPRDITVPELERQAYKQIETT